MGWGCGYDDARMVMRIGTGWGQDGDMMWVKLGMRIWIGWG